VVQAAHPDTDNSSLSAEQLQSPLSGATLHAADQHCIAAAASLKLITVILGQEDDDGEHIIQSHCTALVQLPAHSRKTAMLLTHVTATTLRFKK
jgi:hypothetical protein